MNKETAPIIESPSEFYNSKETIDGDIATINFGPTHPQRMVFSKTFSKLTEKK